MKKKDWEKKLEKIFGVVVKRSKHGEIIEYQSTKHKECILFIKTRNLINTLTKRRT